MADKITSEQRRKNMQAIKSHSKLEENQLFKRFQKQNSAQESTGLGLEISKKIAENYQWTLVYNYNSRLHSFKLNFYRPQFSFCFNSINSIEDLYGFALAKLLLI